MNRILAVDDKMDNLISLSALIRNLMPECTVMTAQSGQEGIKKAVNEKPDMILLDVHMPVMDGFETCRRLKADQRTKPVPVVMITAVRTDAPSRIKGLEIGADAFLAKPIDEFELVSQIKVALRIKAAEDALRTERDRLEAMVQKRTAELRNSEARFQRMLSLIPDMISIHDPDMNIVYSNWKGFAAVDPANRVLNSKCYSTYRGYDNICPDCKAVNVIKTKKQFYSESELPDGTWIELRIIPLVNEKQDVELFVEWVRDITHLKKTEQSLIKAKDAAETANRSKSEFMANMSHEIRTPLNGIVGMLEMLSSTGLEQEQQELIELGQTSARRLTQLLSDILDLSSIEAGKMVIRKNEFSLSDICHSIKDLFAIPCREKGISIECSVDSSLPEKIVGDETRIQQILFNLVGNAVKFTETGHVNVHAYQLSQPENKSIRILFSVTDTGTGIADDKIAELFKPFSQADSSLTRKHQGAGLGLVIVHRLVNMMNGNISMETEPEKGTTVNIALPFDLSDSNTKQSLSKHCTPSRNSEKLNILLAEDDPLNQILIKKMLESKNHTVTLAENGKKAIDELSIRDDIDCILMDIQMPVMTGVEATKTIRSSTELQSKKNIPIIAVTAHTQPGDRERFLEAGMDDYMGKPVSLEEFQRIFDKFFG